MSEVELKPCPFCGKEASVVFQSFVKGYCVICSECGSRTIVANDKNDVIKLWNRRVENDELRKD